MSCLVVCTLFSGWSRGRQVPGTVQCSAVFTVLGPSFPSVFPAFLVLTSPAISSLPCVAVLFRPVPFLFHFPPSFSSRSASLGCPEQRSMTAPSHGKSTPPASIRRRRRCLVGHHRRDFMVRRSTAAATPASSRRSSTRQAPVRRAAVGRAYLSLQVASWPTGSAQSSLSRRLNNVDRSYTTSTCSLDSDDTSPLGADTVISLSLSLSLSLAQKMQFMGVPRICVWGHAIHISLKQPVDDYIIG